jgi:hypothetical protein
MDWYALAKAVHCSGLTAPFGAGQALVGTRAEAGA